MPTAIPPKPASLLGLPAELRLHVYDHLFDAEPLHFSYDRNIHRSAPYVSQHWTHYGTYIKRSKGALSARQALSNLQRTCSFIYGEIQAEVNKKSLALAGMPHREPFAASYGFIQGHTYDLRITGRGPGLSEATWTTLPCPPQDCRALRVELLGSCTIGWGDGGPKPSARDLFQTLNRLLHYGPVMDKKTPLHTPMHIETILIIIKPAIHEQDHSDSEDEDERRRAFTDRVRNVLWLVRALLEGTGLANGLVDRMVVAKEDPDSGVTSTEAEAVVRDRPREDSVPEEWKRYGFEWGVAPAEGE